MFIFILATSYEQEQKKDEPSGECHGYFPIASLFSFIHSLIHSFIHSFIYLFICLCLVLYIRRLEICLGNSATLDLPYMPNIDMGPLSLLYTWSCILRSSGKMLASIFFKLKGKSRLSDLLLCKIVLARKMPLLGNKALV